MQLRFLGQSAFLLEHEGHRVLIDPFIEGNPKCPVSLEEALEWSLDAVLVTHAHGDHWGNAADFGRAGVPLIATVEMTHYAEAQGVKETVGMNIGGTYRAEWGQVTMTPAWHSNSFADGTYGGMPTGLVVEMGGVRLYHAGDTSRFSDMRLIGEMGLDAALLPIGDHYTMGPSEAARCLEWLCPRVAVPMHYGTFPALSGDPQVFAQEGRAYAEVRILAPGEMTNV
ncbi:metal-dependent hydrolase [Deinococcus lacus]|uniref:UPF0173 metal-dependent hydrolase ACFP81_08465 n=1 Tax=Deinococcus lacus TaxID=392561 RepID=A0ABW1YCH9_9DEIO